MGSTGAGREQTRRRGVPGARAALKKAKPDGYTALVAIHSMAETHALTEAGKIRLLTVLSPARSRYLPQVPAVEESGIIQGIGVQWWAGIAFPSATPDAIVQKWEVAMAEMVQDHVFLEGAERIRMNVDYLNAREMRAFVEMEGQGRPERALARLMLHTLV
jgi:tripartite-type tricarboxylate transporter receptor subunit TctC